jgi:hypothetical protein
MILFKENLDCRVAALLAMTAKRMTASQLLKYSINE